MSAVSSARPGCVPASVCWSSTRRWCADPAPEAIPRYCCGGRSKTDQVEPDEGSGWRSGWWTGDDGRWMPWASGGWRMAALEWWMVGAGGWMPRGSPATLRCPCPDFSPEQATSRSRVPAMDGRNTRRQADGSVQKLQSELRGWFQQLPALADTTWNASGLTQRQTGVLMAWRRQPAATVHPPAACRPAGMVHQLFPCRALSGIPERKARARR